MKNLNTLLILIMSCIIIACNTTTKTGAIIPPFTSFEIPFIENEIDPEIDNKLSYKDGSVINIPANSLVNENNELIKAPVVIQFKVFHTASEIIASGIPMAYDSAGVNESFESAGMFDIKAKTKNGKSVFINKNSKIDVAMASFNKGGKFNFYKLNKGDGKWSFLGNSTPKKNDRKTINIQNFKNNNLIQLDLNYNEYPLLKSFNNIDWIFCGEDLKLDPIKNKWIQSEKWRELDLIIVDKQKKIYHLNLKSMRNSISIPVTPYLMSDSVDILKDLNSQIIAQNDYQVEKKKEELNLQFEADITRNYPIQSFGVYNWDKIMRLIKEEEMWCTNANFTIDGNQLTEKIKIYLLVGDQQRMVMKEIINWDKFLFKQKEKNALLIILPDNKIATCNPSEFEKANGKTNFVFNVKKKLSSVTDIKDFTKIIQNL